MKNSNFYIILLGLFLCSFAVGANQLTVEEGGKEPNQFISVKHAYIRRSIPGTTITSSYMTIENKGEKTVTLLGASSKISRRIEIHHHSMLNGMMRMRQLDSIDIKANDRIVLQPSGLHLMIFDVKKPLKAQQNVKLTLHFSNQPPLMLQVPVYSPLQEKISQEADTQITTEHTHHH